MNNRPLVGLNDKLFPAHQLASCIVDVCTARDVNIHRLLRGTGIFADDLLDGRPLSAHQLLSLLINAQQLTPGYDCSFQIGRRLVNSHNDPVMQAAKHARSFMEVMRILNVYGLFVSPFLTASFYKDGKSEIGYLALQQRFGCQKVFQFVIEIYCTALVALNQQLLGRRMAVEFHFPFKRPRHIQEYEENLGYRLKFEQPALLVSFAKSEAKIRYSQHNDWVKRHAIRQIKAHYPCVHTLLDITRRLIQTSPEKGLSDIASDIGMSPATFKRKLKEQGVTFKQLHDDTRLQEAINCLLVQRLNNEQSASHMSFSDLTNFRRSIKRWTGFTPNELRQSFQI